MRISTRIGDIFIAQLDNGKLRFFQLIARDQSSLNGDVIRIFASHYNKDGIPSIEELIKGPIERYMHTYVINGIRLGYWEKFANTKDIGTVNIYFKDSLDDFYPRHNVVSKRWEIWVINGPRLFVGELPKECAKYEIGTVFAPIAVMIQLNTGNYQEPCYPLY